MSKDSIASKERDGIAIKHDLQTLRGHDGDYVISTITDLYALIDYIQERTALSKIEAIQNLIDTHHRTATFPSMETIQAFQDGQMQAYQDATPTKRKDES